MPKQIYTVEYNGTEYEIEGDRTPTEADMASIIGSSVENKAENTVENTIEKVGGVLGIGAIDKEKYEAGERNLLGNIFDRPAAAVRSGIQSAAEGKGFVKGYTEGAVNPTNVPTFQNIALDKYYGSDVLGKDPGLLKTTVGNLVSAGGMTADIIANPADVLSTLVPGLKGGRAAIKAGAGVIDTAGEVAARKTVELGSKAANVFTKESRIASKLNTVEKLATKELERQNINLASATKLNKEGAIKVATDRIDEINKAKQSANQAIEVLQTAKDSGTKRAAADRLASSIETISSKSPATKFILRQLRGRKLAKNIGYATLAVGGTPVSLNTVIPKAIKYVREKVEE